MVSSRIIHVSQILPATDPHFKRSMGKMSIHSNLLHLQAHVLQKNMAYSWGKDVFEPKKPHLKAIIKVLIAVIARPEISS